MSGGELCGTNLTKVFPGGIRALDGVTFKAGKGRVLTLLGPSGCGKSTLLRIVAGLDHPSAGSLELDGRSLLDVPAERREVGFVFQNYALYPHLSVAGNMALALEARRVPRAERERRVRETAELLGIAGLLGRRPGDLSGGQQQRTALGRALIKRPRLYLLDEPLSNLDALLREGMRSELKALFRRVDATVIYVTHDQAEAMSLSDRVAVMREGRILQCGSPLEVYARPEDLFVATFVGSPRMTIWRGRRDGSDIVFASGLRLPVADGVPPDREIAVGVRAEDVQVFEAPEPGAWPADLMVSEPLGPHSLLTLRIGDAEARALAPPRDWPERLWMKWSQDRLHWFDAVSGGRLPVS